MADKILDIGMSLVEDENYQMKLRKSEGEHLRQELHLYKVRFRVSIDKTPDYEISLYVLAESEEAAYGQAECAFKVENTVERVPFMLRGWSGKVH